MTASASSFQITVHDMGLQDTPYGSFLFRTLLCIFMDRSFYLQRGLWEGLLEELSLDSFVSKTTALD